MDSDLSGPSGKIFPMDLAPQKITIVKNVSSADVKISHLISTQQKPTVSGPVISHAGPVGLMRPATQIISSGVSSQPQMIVNGSPLLQSSQLVSQASQLLSGPQIITQPIVAGGPLLSPNTQIISQGTQLSAQVSSAITGNNVGTGSAPLLSVGVRTLPAGVRVLPPLSHSASSVSGPRPLASGVNSVSGVVVSNARPVSSHVPRGLAAGASLAVRPALVTPAPTLSQSPAIQGTAWSATNVRSVRGAVVYSPRPAPRATPPPAPSAIVTLPSAPVLTSSTVIASGLRAGTPPRPLPLLQRNYHPAKVIGPANPVRVGAVGNSAPPQLYYEPPRASAPSVSHPSHTSHPPHLAQPAPLNATLSAALHQVSIVSGVPTLVSESRPQTAPLTSAAASNATILNAHSSTIPTLNSHGSNTSGLNVLGSTASALSVHGSSASGLSVLGSTAAALNAHGSNASALNILGSTASVLSAHGSTASVLNAHDSTNSVLNVHASSANVLNAHSTVSLLNATALTVAGVLRKRELDGLNSNTDGAGREWDGVVRGVIEPIDHGSGGSTTVSAASSPPPDNDEDMENRPDNMIVEPEERECRSTESPPAVVKQPKRPLLSSTFVCGWRATSMHFNRPSDVRRRPPRTRDLISIAAHKHALAQAEGWKLHHLTHQMDDLVSLEADAGAGLTRALRTLESSSGALQHRTHALLELLKGNIQRSKIVCEGIGEAREDVLRVFTHRDPVASLLQAHRPHRAARRARHHASIVY